MLTIEQAIERYGQYINFCEYQGLAVQKEELEQMTEWLRELQERRKAPEIIRCKDCKWWKKQKDSAQGRCRLLGIYPTGGWYCANAERRTDK